MVMRAHAPRQDGLASLGDGELEMLVQRRLSNRTRDAAGAALSHMGPYPLDDDLTPLPCARGSGQG